ncbi:MAG: D-2-hydroxyacid dehydrogenase [Hyphomicrobiales bacterium]|nr:MAG: D-2-hydroxyacid dehydrogenase [Hyphomicrobiales bacterium]
MTKGKRIAVIGPVFADYRLSDSQLGRIRQAAPDATLTVLTDPAAFRARLAEADVAAGQIGRQAALPPFGRLAWFHTWSAGTDGEPAEALLASNIRLTCSKGNGAIPIAEFTIWAMLTIARRATSWLDAQTRHEWRRHTSPELHGATLGLIGLGHIGGEIARRAAAFGMRCIAVRRDAGAVNPGPHVSQVLPPDRLMEMLAVADFVVVAAPLTPETRGMLGEMQFRAMKPTAFYVCVSRGAIADPDVLRRALAEEWIAGAVLDAHATEPLPPGDLFWDLPNTIVTPHNAGTTIGTADRAIEVFVENLGRLERGEPLHNVIETGIGY